MKQLLKEKPSKKHLITVQSNTDEWLELRRSLIGGSDIATIFNMNPWMTRHNLYEIKTLQNVQQEPTFRMQAGHYLEDAIAQLSFNYVKELVTINPDIGIRVHHVYEYLSSTLDRWGTYVREDGTFGKYVLDCKNSGVNQYRKLKSAIVPSYNYWLQIQQQLLTTQKSIKPDKGYLACWTGGQMLKVFEIKPCIVTQTAILKYGAVFNQCVINKIEPIDSMFIGLDDYSFMIDELVANTSKVILAVE